MQIINGLKSITTPLENSLCVIGNFDGLHKGHANLLASAKKIAIEHKLLLTILTFEPHTKIQIKQSYNGRIISFYHKMLKLKEIQVDRVLLIRPKDQIFGLRARDFINAVLIEKLNTNILMVGEDFRFAYKREGSSEDLKNRKFKLIVTPLSKFEDNKYSSSTIKNFIGIADLKNVNQNLGYNYSIIGRVKRGKQLGRTLGFPTLNIDLDQLMPLKFGVYAAKICFLDNQEHIYHAVINIGVNPTIAKNNKPILEAHILGNFNQEKYGCKVQITPIQFFREEIKFSNLEELQQQITKDCEWAKNQKML